MARLESNSVFLKSIFAVFPSDCEQYRWIQMDSVFLKSIFAQIVCNPDCLQARLFAIQIVCNPDGLQSRWFAIQMVRKFDLFSLHLCRSYFPRLSKIQCELLAIYFCICLETFPKK